MDTIVFVVFLIVLTAAVVILMRRRLSLDSEPRPRMSSPAMVMSMRKKMVPYINDLWDRRFGEIHDPSERDKQEPMDWFITFRLITGEMVELLATQKMYEASIVGDEGNLEWTDERLVCFTPAPRERNK